MDDKEEASRRQQGTSAQVDGPAFLTSLRSAGAFDQTNEATIGRGNTSAQKHQTHPQSMGSLPELFSFDDKPALKSDAKMAPEDMPDNKNHHHRGVSWGGNSTDYFEDDMSSIGTESRRQLIPQFDEPRNGPFVEEAELHILRSLEQQGSISNLDMESPSFLSQVPEHAAHDFSIDEPKRRKTSEDQPRSPREEEDKPLVSNRAAEERSNRHRRTMTVEDKLEGLTSAMSALQNVQHTRTANSTGSDDTNAGANGNQNTAFEQLADNADRILQEDNTRRKARGMWNLLLDNLPALREEMEEENQAEATDKGSFSDDGRDDHDLEAQEESNSASSNSTKHGERQRKKNSRGSVIANRANDKFKEDIEIWKSFFRPRQDTVWTYVKYVLFYLIIPLVGVAAALFYIGDNPMQGKLEDGSTGDKPSVAWWLLFVVRQVVTLSMALALQGLIIDFLALGTKIILRLVGPVVTLLIVQAKGWPFVGFMWSLLNFAMLSGKGQFSHHWLFYQNAFGLFNSENPSGNVVESEVYLTILTIAVSVSVLVAVKRVVVGLYLGRQTFKHYGEELASVMKKMVLVSEVAALAKEVEKSMTDEQHHQFSLPSESGCQLRGIAQTISDDDDNGTVRLGDKVHRDPITGSFRTDEKEKLMRLLGHWEEPEDNYNNNQKEIASISAVLKFRRALTLIQRRYPFSYSFGLAEKREDCIDSAQRVYDKLLMHTPDRKVLQFETLAMIAVRSDGKTVNEQKAKDLVKVFRPDREGNLTVVDWIKSVDSVYKQFRLLTASIDNSSQIDKAFENIINTVFYTIIITVTMSQLGFNPLAMFLSLSSIILAFAFAIGSASAKYFEGLLFILVRRPYNIGDMCHFSNIETDTSFDGAPGWIIEHVTLFQTIARWLPTNERCSLSNGSLASSRIINWQRSSQAQFHLFYKIPIGAPYEKIVILKNAIEEFMRARPREWLRFNGFRANRIEIEKGYVEYVIVIQHRDAWQNIGQILDSKANMSSYILEVTQQLGLNYKAPPLPVNLKYMKAMFDTDADDDKQKDEASRMEDFRNIVNKHNIRLN